MDKERPGEIHFPSRWIRDDTDERCGREKPDTSKSDERKPGAAFSARLIPVDGLTQYLPGTIKVPSNTPEPKPPGSDLDLIEDLRKDNYRLWKALRNLVESVQCTGPSKGVTCRVATPRSEWCPRCVACEELER